MSIPFCFLCLVVPGLDDKPASTALPVAEVRKVVAAIVEAAEENSRRPANKLKEDELFDHYVRRAAAAARDQRVSPQAFLLALGVALDHTGFLRNNPLIRPTLVQLESDQERQHRLKVVGTPTLRHREDWALHFAIAAALTAHLGADMAERLSIAKELWDARGDSGFSFADLAADYAGIELAKSLLANEGEATKRLRSLAERFTGNDFLPKLDDLEDGLPLKQFEEKYGGVRDPRFLRHCAEVRARVLQSPGFQPAGERKD
jgi:hypothetical protein